MPTLMPPETKIVTFKIDPNKIRPDGSVPASREQAFGPLQELGVGDPVAVTDYDGEVFRGRVQRITSRLVHLRVELQPEVPRVTVTRVGQLVEMRTVSNVAYAGISTGAWISGNYAAASDLQVGANYSNPNVILPHRANR